MAEPQGVLAGLGDAEAKFEPRFTCRICGAAYAFADHHACLDRGLSARTREANYIPTVWRRPPEKGPK